MPLHVVLVSTGGHTMVGQLGQTHPVQSFVPRTFCVTSVSVSAGQLGSPVHCPLLVPYCVPNSVEQIWLVSIDPQVSVIVLVHTGVGGGVGTGGVIVMLILSGQYLVILRHTFGLLSLTLACRASPLG